MARDLTLYGTRSFLIWHEILPYMAGDFILYGTRFYLIWHEILSYMAPPSQAADSISQSQMDCTLRPLVEWVEANIPIIAALK